MSIVRKQFRDCVPQWMRRSPEVKNNWDSLLQTLEGHSSKVNAVAFSPDGKLLVSASDDGTVKFWDAGLGVKLQTVRLRGAGPGTELQRFKGHSGSVNAVAFSPDGKTLASVSDHGTIQLWDAGSGAALQTLEGHSGLVNAVAFSSDGKTLASASDDGCSWQGMRARCLEVNRSGDSSLVLRSAEA